VGATNELEEANEDLKRAAERVAKTMQYLAELSG